MRVGIATDHAGLLLKEEPLNQLQAAGHEMVDFGAYELNPSDDYLDIIISTRTCSSGRLINDDLRTCSSANRSSGIIGLTLSASYATKPL
jgi:ribose 5-phosphate isomerase B